MKHARYGLLSFIALSALLFLFFSPSSPQQPGRILYVNSTDPTCGARSPCFTSIQSAVDAALPGDTIQIQAGTYPERVTISRKNNTTTASESDRIVIEADPVSLPGSVVITGSSQVCANGFAFRLQQSKFITIRGVTISGAAGPAIELMGANNQNQAIHIERNRIFGNGSGECHGGIAIAKGNPDTLIVNNLIYANVGNGITFLDADTGPYHAINNTIHGNGWNGVSMVQGQQVFLVNNIITQNGTATGTTGGRFGVSRVVSPGAQPQGINLLHNLICGNRLGEISGPVLDAADSGNLTPQGSEGAGVSASPGCEVPSNVYANVNGPDGLPNTADDDFALKLGSVAIDRGMDPRTLGLSALFNPILEADFLTEATRPQDGDGDGTALFDIGALESQDVFPPQVTFLNPGENSFVRQTVTVTAQATDNDNVAGMTLMAGTQALTASLSPAPPAPSVTATSLWDTRTSGDGSLSLTATATDRAGNSSSASRSVIVDNTPPDTQITGGPEGDIGETTATFSFTGTDNLTSPADLVFSWRLDGGTFTPFSAERSATFTGLGEGPHTFEVKARDLVGNEDLSPAVRSFNVRLAPTITSVDPPSGFIGTLVTINGSRFEPGSTQVTFNGVAAAIRTVTSTVITTSVPPNATTGPLTVTTSRGTATSPQPFTVLTNRDFTLSVSPAAGNVVQGTSTTYAVEITSTGSEPLTSLAQLSTGSLPLGVTASFAPSTLGSNTVGILTLTTTDSSPVGASTVEVRATASVESRSVTRTASITLNVQAPGQTVLVGQVRDGDDRPLPAVSIKLGGTPLTELGTTDAAGNFFIPLSVVGSQVFVIDGSTANTSTLNYPTIPVTLAIQSGLVNSLGYIPRLKAQPVAKLTPIIPGQATVFTDPDLPGFTMTIPSGVEIIGWDGKPNTQFGVTVVPLDRSPLPPFPPGLNARRVYLFSFGKMGGGTPTGNIPIDTPNDVGGLPGDKIDRYYFNEAPDGTAPNQWEKYGTGTVSSDGTRIVTDINPATGLPFGIPRFCCGAVVNAPQASGETSGGSRDGGELDGEPVDTATGLFYMEKTDLVLPGILPVVVSRTYRTNLRNVGPFGVGTSWPYDIFLRPPPNGSSDALLLFSPGNRQDLFSRQPDGSFVNTTSPSLRGAVVTVAGGILSLRFKDGSLWRFARFDGAGRLISQADRNGNTVTLRRDTGGRVIGIKEPTGREITASYDTNNPQIDRMRDPLGRLVRYSYDFLGRLTSVTDPAGGVTRYTYDGASRMVSITDPRGITFLTNEYDSAGRVIRQTQADGGAWTFAYTTNGSFISQTVVTNPRGQTTTYRFNAAGYLISQTDALGQTTVFERQPGTNLLISTTDPLGRVTRFEYDAAGNVTKITDPSANVRTFTYEPTFNKVTSITDPLDQVTSFEYDLKGNLTATVDPAGARTTIAYNTFGQPISMTDPLGNSTVFEYNAAGDLVAIVDPLGNRTTGTYDVVGRLIQRTDPRGKLTSFAYDPLSRLAQTTDPKAGVTQFSYDGNGNLLTVRDARGNTVVHNYDSMDRLATRTDPLGAAEFFEYDGMGNLTRHVDRIGQVALFAYDPANRLLSGNYADGSTTKFVYDAVGHLIEARDSAGGIILNNYDALDRLVAQITNLGTVSYQYDALGRRTQMDTPSQTPVTYGYDAASRLRQVMQGSHVVDLAYDALGRRTKLTLPNGVSTEYQYDAASRLTELIYRNGLNVLGNLTYSYDPAGNRNRVGGSFARTLLPDPVPSATYDAANRQLRFGDKTMTFDANGNLTSITEPSGVTTFTWDARNRLASLNGPSATGTFGYDAFGRRIEKTVNDQRSQYLYDGVNPIQETSGTTVVANILTGLGIDEYFTRTDSTGTQHLLPDALGSIIALTDPTGAIRTQYTYEPFGRTTTSGALSPNPFQYTGRENDGNILYYYRARYYQPQLQRFIQEDPIGFFGGDINLYAYVGNSPILYIDPLGLDKRPFGPPQPCPTMSNPNATCRAKARTPEPTRTPEPKSEGPEISRDPLCKNCPPGITCTAPYGRCDPQGQFLPRQFPVDPKDKINETMREIQQLIIEEFLKRGRDD